MPSEWSDQQQYEWGQEFVDRAFGESGVTSGDKYYAWLQENDIDVKRAIARETWNEYKNSYQWLDTLQKYPETATIPRGWYAQSKSTYFKNYGAAVNITYIDPDTGEEVTVRRTLKGAGGWTKDAISEGVETNYSTDADSPLGEIVSYEIVTLYHNRNAKW